LPQFPPPPPADRLGVVASTAYIPITNFQRFSTVKKIAEGRSEFKSQEDYFITAHLKCQPGRGERWLSGAVRMQNQFQRVSIHMPNILCTQEPYTGPVNWSLSCYTDVDRADCTVHVSSIRLQCCTKFSCFQFIPLQ